ncbi:hypothetical protein [Frigoriglobus tundricola]|uniref:hypothetical protein n=1 Tax=Frigoriglobus tundricola TaxID=2774151 RepID=UPI00148EEBA9|nr:hypothetical protein [Frigoriglobus tundricola]
MPLTGGDVALADAAGAVLTQFSADRAADQSFVDCEARVRGAAHECALIVDDLKDAAGGPWPRPPRCPTAKPTAP